MRAYLDQAATSWPKPKAVSEAVAHCLCGETSSPGRSHHVMGRAADDVVSDARQAVAELIGANAPEEIAFFFNATDALNAAIKGILRPGDHAVTSSMEHNSVYRPLAALARDGVITLSEVQADPAGLVHPSDVAAALTGSTRLVVLTHASNVTGTIQPIAEIARVVHAVGAILLVDGAQSCGAMPISVRDLGADLFAFAGHKGPLGPQGTGGLYARPGVSVHPWREGGTGVQGESDLQPGQMPVRLEAGTPNTPGLAGLAAGARYLLNMGLDRVRAREEELTTHFLRGLEALDAYHVYGPPNATHRLPVVSVTLPGIAPLELDQRIDQEFGIAVRTGLHCAPHAHRTIGTFPAGAVRFSFNASNTEAELDYALETLARLARPALVH